MANIFYNYLLTFSYTESETEKIVEALEGYYLSDEKKIIRFFNAYQLFLQYGFTEDEYKKMVLKFPTLITFTTEKIKEKLTVYFNYFGQEEVLKILRQKSSFLSSSVEKVMHRVWQLENLGYNREQVIKIVTKAPSILTFSEEQFKSSIVNLIVYGFTFEEVLEIFTKHPTFLCLSWDNLVESFLNFEKKELSKEEIIEMAVKSPQLYSYTPENINRKYKVLSELGFWEDILKRDLESLRISAGTIYARYLWLESLGTRHDTIRTYITRTNKTFEKKFGIKKEDLISLYQSEIATYFGEPEEKVLELTPN